MCTSRDKTTLLTAVAHLDVHGIAMVLRDAAEHPTQSLPVCLLCQVVCITDPVLATQVLRSKVVDKLRFQYSFLDPVRLFWLDLILACCRWTPSRLNQARTVLFGACWTSSSECSRWSGRESCRRPALTGVCVPQSHAQFLGGQNMLTGHTNGHWKAVRKAVAPAFSAGNIKWVPRIVFI